VPFVPYRGALLGGLLFAVAFDDDFHEGRIRRQQRQYEGGQAHPKQYRFCLAAVVKSYAAQEGVQRLAKAGRF
jgi:hypothetical protein